MKRMTKGSWIRLCAGILIILCGIVEVVEGVSVWKYIVDFLLGISIVLLVVADNRGGKTDE